MSSVQGGDCASTDLLHRLLACLFSHSWPVSVTVKPFSQSSECLNFEVMSVARATYLRVYGSIWAVKADELVGAVAVCERSWTLK